jgi:hypothetical protein
LHRLWFRTWTIRLLIHRQLLCFLAHNLCHRRFDAHAIRFRLERVVLDHGNTAPERIPHAPLLLLKDVPEFMSQEFLSLNCVRIVLTGSEVDISAPRVSDGAERGRFMPNVNADI